MPGRFNIALALTWFRIAAIPLIVLVFFLPFAWSGLAALLVFTLAGITDWLDGWVARRFNQESRFGAFLDPVADKLMVSTALVLVVQGALYWQELLTVIAAIIIGREITVSALREWMAEMGARDVVAVSGFGKIKTTLQMVGLGAMLFGANPPWLPIYDIGMGFLIGAAGMTLWSMIIYLRAAAPEFRKGDE